MPILPEYATPKGNTSMTLFNENNDDTIMPLPSMDLTFSYGENSITTLFVSGNSFVGFGSQSEHLKINRRDASYNKLFYCHETNGSVLMFRVRFEGNSVYSSWNTNDLIWELVVYMDGTFMLIIEKTPGNGMDSLENPTVGTQMLAFEQGKSYVFSLQPNGSYDIVEGSYSIYESKYLIQDNEGIKKFDELQNLWVLQTEPPVTKDMFLEYGVNTLPNTLEGVSENAKLLIFTTDNDIILNPTNYKAEVRQIVTSRPKTIVQTEDLNIIRPIESMEIRTSTVGGSVYFALSFDSGNSYYTTSNGVDFTLIDINNIEEFTQNGINAEDFQLDYAVLNSYITDKLRLAYLLVKPNLTDICKLKAVKINYEQL